MNILRYSVYLNDSVVTAILSTSKSLDSVLVIPLLCMAFDQEEDDTRPALDEAQTIVNLNVAAGAESIH
jgi:hypothetical protein